VLYGGSLGWVERWLDSRWRIFAVPDGEVSNAQRPLTRLTEARKAQRRCWTRREEGGCPDVRDSAGGLWCYSEKDEVKRRGSMLSQSSG